MDAVVAPPTPPQHTRRMRHDSVRSDLSVESDATFRSLENGEITASTAMLSPDGGSLFSSVVGGPSAPALPEHSSRIVYVNNSSKNADFCDNKVVTAKYTKLNFLPRFFYARLAQVANFYFLLVGAGQIIPAISSTQGLPYQWMVLLIVLSIDAVFAAIEDNARHRADAKMNARLTRVFDPNEPSCFREMIWRDVRAGDILKVCNYDAVPADILLLAVAEPDPQAPVGICFVETKSLDGETNLKVRQALSCTFSQLNDPRSLGHLPGRVICELPNHDVNNFSGRFEPHKGHTIPIDLKNIALRGSVIRNTPYVYGLVLNTGKDTKIMQSASETPMKTSKILMIVNRGIGILMAALLVLCVLGAVLCSIWIAQNYDRATYLMLHDLSGMAPFRNDIVGWAIYMGYYWILIASFVPITLYVTVAIVKSYQTFFLNRDIHMYDEATDTPALVRNADLNDDLGQVTHIFSDKTGTLTANEMDFRKMSVHGVSYGRGTTEIGREAVRRLGKDISASDVLADNTPFEKALDNVRFIDPQGEYVRDCDVRTNPVQAAWIEAFLTHLAVCHSVVLEQGEGGVGTKFSASSPDELALVSGAKFFGYDFIARKNGSISIHTPASPDKEVVYELLEMIDFTSARKRMSVVVRTPDKRILLLTKGADSVIFARLHPENCDPHIVEITTQHLERFAGEGLRTLVIAQKEIPEAAYLEWSREYKNALSDLEQVQRQKMGEPNHIEELEESLEMGLELLGATAIEDRLQDQVTSTIADLARAGIKIWILTGDKEETAINIGFACQLLHNDMERLIINTDTYPTSSSLYDLLYYRCKQLRSDRKEGVAHGSQAIIIDGRSLTMVFNHQALCDLFLEVSQYCAAVICCRVSPKQKAQVVRLYKTNIPGCRSLAIGDGANDVGMIQEAHIGIGISGHEGMQAVNSSDFAIAQFRFLKRLLLVHGHWNYRRMAKLALYVVYKNIILYCACFVLGTLSGGSGTLYYNNMWINGYNIFWTSLPIGVVGVLEQEVPAYIANKYPGLYYAGAQGEQFSLKIFAAWILEALYEGTACALVPALLVGYIDSQGNSYSRDVCGAISYCAMIIVGWAKLALNIVTWNFVTAGAFVISFVFWFVCGYIISVGLPTLVSDVAFPYIFTLVEFYILVYLTLLLCLGRDFLFKAYKREMYPEYYHVLQEHHKLKTDEENAKWTPPNLRYHLFHADLVQPKPQFELLEQLASASPTRGKPAMDRQKAYTGFAFSTQILEDRFINPLRDLVLPVTQVVDVIGRRFARSPRAGEEEGPSFEEKVKALPIDEQAVYEIQRFQIFAGWGSSLPGHLFITDPPRYTNADMTDGSWTFDLSEWMIDNRFGGSDQWQYATKFKDFLRDPNLSHHKHLTARERRRLKKKLNKLVGRCVRRRRWVRRERIIAEIVAAVDEGEGSPRNTHHQDQQPSTPGVEAGPPASLVVMPPPAPQQ